MLSPLVKAMIDEAEDEGAIQPTIIYSHYKTQGVVKICDKLQEMLASHDAALKDKVGSYHGFSPPDKQQGERWCDYTDRRTQAEEEDALRRRKVQLRPCRLPSLTVPPL